MASSLEVLALAQLAFLANTPTAMLWQNTVQSVPSGTTFATAVNWDSASEDNWSGHSGVTNPSRYTVQVAGMYRVSASLTYSNSAGLAVRALEIQKSGVFVSGTQAYNQSYSNNFLTVQLPSVLVRCVVGDYLQALTWQNSGAALNTVGSDSYMSVDYVHA